MKRFLLSLGVASLALTSFAADRVLYTQNFESVGSPADAGWSYGGASMTIASDQFGKYLELSQGQTNGRSAQVTWGQDIFLKDGESVLEDGTYMLSYDFAIIKGSNNQYNGEFTVFTNHAPIANNLYRTPWSQKIENSCWNNYLFDMKQNEVDKLPLGFAIDGPTVETKNEEGEVTGYSIDTNDYTTFAEGTWYTVTLNVNVNTREVEYSVVALDGTPVKDGTHVVPETNPNGEAISMYAEGLFIMVARYQTIIDVDNIKIWYESSSDYANDPTIALTRLGQTADEQLDLNVRAYTITFAAGETLHVTGTDGQTVEVEYDDCEGAYIYETTKSGLLKAWTTSGEATSAVIEAEVDCAPCQLPEVTATITSVKPGYGKTYTLTVNNADVPLRPTIFINYSFTGVNGEKVEAEGEASGVKVTVSEEGTLVLTSEAFGYEAAISEVQNDIEFATKKVYDFARMTEEEIKAAGFPAFETLNSSKTSGFDNWTARKRLFYELEGSGTEDPETGAIVYEKVFPFGFVSEESETNVLHYSVIDRSAADSVSSYSYFEGLSIFPTAGKVETGLPNLGFIEHVGIYNDQTKNNNNDVVVLGLDETDFVVVNTIGSYGSNSNHPMVATNEEYYALLAGDDTVLAAKDGVANEDGTYDVTYWLYRIDTALTCLTVYSQVGGTTGINGVNTEAQVEGDGYFYTVDGLRLAQPTRPGLYIHNGKKIIVRK